MAADSGVDLDVLKVDGGVTANELCMQLQADILGVPVSRPRVAETTALGAAYAAGLAVGFFAGSTELDRQLARGRALGTAVVGRRSATRGYARWQQGGRTHPRLGLAQQQVVGHEARLGDRQQMTAG